MASAFSAYWRARSLCSIRQGSFSEVGVRVGRIRISEEVDLKDLDRRFGLAHAQIVSPYDLGGNFGEQLRLKIFPPGFRQLLRDLEDSSCWRIGAAATLSAGCCRG